MKQKEYNFKYKIYKENKTYKVIISNIKNKKQLNNFLNILREEYY